MSNALLTLLFQGLEVRSRAYPSFVVAGLCLSTAVFAYSGLAFAEEKIPEVFNKITDVLAPSEIDSDPAMGDRLPDFQDKVSEINHDWLNGKIDGKKRDKLLSDLIAKSAQFYKPRVSTINPLDTTISLNAFAIPSWYALSRSLNLPLTTLARYYAYCEDYLAALAEERRVKTNLNLGLPYSSSDEFFRNFINRNSDQKQTKLKPAEILKRIKDLEHRLTVWRPQAFNLLARLQSETDLASHKYHIALKVISGTMFSQGDIAGLSHLGLSAKGVETKMLELAAILDPLYQELNRYGARYTSDGKFGNPFNNWNLSNFKVSHAILSKNVALSTALGLFLSPDSRADLMDPKRREAIHVGEWTILPVSKKVPLKNRETTIFKVIARKSWVAQVDSQIKIFNDLIVQYEKYARLATTPNGTIKFITTLGQVLNKEAETKRRTIEGNITNVRTYLYYELGVSKEQDKAITEKIQLVDEYYSYLQKQMIEHGIDKAWISTSINLGLLVLPFVKVFQAGIAGVKVGAFAVAARQTSMMLAPALLYGVARGAISAGAAAYEKGDKAEAFWNDFFSASSEALTVTAGYSLTKGALIGLGAAEGSTGLITIGATSFSIDTLAAAVFISGAVVSGTLHGADCIKSGISLRAASNDKVSQDHRNLVTANAIRNCGAALIDLTAAAFMVKGPLASMKKARTVETLKTVKPGEVQGNVIEAKPVAERPLNGPKDSPINQHIELLNKLDPESAKVTEILSSKNPFSVKKAKLKGLIKEFDSLKPGDKMTEADIESFSNSIIKLFSKGSSREMQAAGRALLRRGLTQSLEDMGIVVSKDPKWLARWRALFSYPSKPAKALYNVVRTFWKTANGNLGPEPTEAQIAKSIDEIMAKGLDQWMIEFRNNFNTSHPKLSQFYSQWNAAVKFAHIDGMRKFQQSLMDSAFGSTDGVVQPPSLSKTLEADPAAQEALKDYSREHYFKAQVQAFLSTFDSHQELQSKPGLKAKERFMLEAIKLADEIESSLGRDPSKVAYETKKLEISSVFESEVTRKWSK